MATIKISRMDKRTETVGLVSQVSIDKRNSPLTNDIILVAAHIGFAHLVTDS